MADIRSWLDGSLARHARTHVAWFASLVAAIAGAVIAVHAWYAVAGAYYVGHVSAVWLTLADDFSRGEMYRPLVGPARVTFPSSLSPSAR
jgi:lysylphosphatidylglycerol synthetase-like protein (DUF2156 family)